jgi:outer membrane scaffolding protein for murein synthesis (MipA/OmpV family)
MRRLAVLLAGLIPALCAAQDRPTIIGAAIRSRPAYDGSSSQVTDIIPQLRYYGKPWFARTTQGILEAGVQDELAPKFWAGAQIAYEAGRKTSESPFLEARNEPDIKASASVGLHLEWDRNFGRVPVNFLIRARQDLDADLGGHVDLRVNVGVFSRFGMEGAVYAQATWGSESAMQSWYGAPSSGLIFTAVGFLAGYDITRHWLLVGHLEFRKLYDEAAESPLTQQTSNWYGSAGIAYRF